MNALRYEPGSRLLRLAEVARPEAAPGEVLVEVEACGLCGTDVEILSGERPLPRPVTLGHEIAGTVRAAGSESGSTLVGRRVVAVPVIACGACRQCDRGATHLCVSREVIGLHRDGGLAPYVAVPEGNIVPLPDEVDAAHGAIAVDAVATPFHALIGRARLEPGEAVAVFGVGGLGQHAIQIARSAGATTVIGVDPRAEARSRATQLGVEAAVDASHPRLDELIRDATGGRGVDVAIGFAGGEAVIGSMLGCLDSGGRAVMVAMTHEQVELAEPGLMVQKEIALLGSYGFSKRTVTDVLTEVASGRLDLSESISHEVTPEGAARMLGLMRDGESDVRRVVVRPSR